MSITIKPRRIFSEELKKGIVGQIEQGSIRIREVSREYQVSPSVEIPMPLTALFREGVITLS